MSKVSHKRSYEDAHMTLQVVSTADMGRKKHKPDLEDFIDEFAALSIAAPKQVEQLTYTNTKLLIQALCILFAERKSILKNEHTARPTLPKRVRFVE